MMLISGSNTDYIGKSGIVYGDYGNDLFYPKYPRENNRNHYMYTSVLFSDGKIRSRRVHVLIAKAFLFNPNPKIFNIVGHKDNNKQNNSLENLYWTTNQENAQKAVDDGLNKAKSAEDNDKSYPVKVLDKNTLSVVAVYGSLSECARRIENIDKTAILKLYKKPNGYKPRFKKYIYQKISLEEFLSYPEEIRNINLVETPPTNKKPKIFRMTNTKMRYSQIMDNQTEAEKITGVKQAIISHILKEHKTDEYNGWTFELLGEKEYTESSAYQNLLQTVDAITVENINTGQRLTFNTIAELTKYFGLKGHDGAAYFKTGHTLLSEWKMVGKENKQVVEYKNVG